MWEWCWRVSLFGGGVLLEVFCFIFFLKLVIFDFIFGVDLVLILLFFRSFCKICVFMILFGIVLELGLFCDIYCLLFGGRVDEVLLLFSFFVIGSVFVWFIFFFGEICFDWYIVGLKLLFIDEEDGECMFLMMIEVLIFVLEFFDDFFLGVILFDVEDIDEFVFFFLRLVKIVGLVCYDCFVILFLISLGFMIFLVGYDFDGLWIGWLLVFLDSFEIVLNLGGIFWGICLWFWEWNEVRSLEVLCFGGGVGYCLCILLIEEFILFIEFIFEVFLFLVIFGIVGFYGRCIFILLLGIVYILLFYCFCGCYEDNLLGCVLLVRVGWEVFFWIKFDEL